MTIKRSSWVINAILILAVVALLGVSTIPPITEAFRASSSASSEASPTPTLTSRQAKLEAQERGYELVLEREPENQSVLRGLLDVRLELRDIPGAIAPLEKLVQLNPQDVQYHVLLAEAKNYTGHPDSAAQIYRQVLSQNPGEMTALQGLVDLQLQQKNPQAAIGVLEETLQKATAANETQAGTIDTASVKLLLGRVYADLERYEEAIAVYDRAIEENETDFRPLLGKAIVLQRQGKPDQAKPLFANATTLAPPEYKDEINRLMNQEE
ncbi:tetratricopeptide repeat protein [Roseofilum sp. BLCC_M91]|uniref:Tetratricopeptide repeat protein n=1 Tax=Roseofilum halophilum BLCC-M91 TaxID=3022259 RepID=A0ABT7BJL0_9CYAN|nr:tetratricopeptide repeat protein [Roseofilum halophilum]MDJ1178789.1 tetratricopeptide repeat protein [Roseofilum halophilum BLCC-M91]